MTTAWALPPVDCSFVGPLERLGRYDVIGMIAEGGMGIVLRGRDRLNGRHVALKIVRSNRRADAASLRREIAALGGMSHPGIIRMVEDGTSNGAPWMALELLEGRTVCDEIELLWPRQGPTMPADICATAPAAPCHAPSRPPRAASDRLHDVMGIAARVCGALDYVHRLGLVHRDVKPSNVFLGGDGRVTLIDFGLVCRARDTTGAGCSTSDPCVGTMEYAAPEQMRGEPVDGRADIYSLGCVLYELLTGRRPTDGDDERTHAEPKPGRGPVAPSTVVSGVPRPLGELLMAMLARRPDDRPASAAIVAALLADQLAIAGAGISRPG